MQVQHGRYVVGAVMVAMLASVGADARAQPSTYAGQRVGRSERGVDVRVKRELGSSAGYLDRWQAAAVARMSGAADAVLVKGPDARWHALETTASFYPGGTPADMSVREIVPLPPTEMIAPEQLRFGPLKRVAARQEGASLERLAALVFGVSEKEVKGIPSSSGRRADFINVNFDLAEDGAHGPELPDGTGFKPRKRTAIEVQLAELANPRKAGAVLFHELVHRDDYAIAQGWVMRYETETRQKFAPVPFVTWLDAKKTLPAADKELVSEIVRDVKAATEARAYVRTFIAAIEAGAPDIAQSQLETYAYTLVTPGKGAEPTTASVPVALRAELETAYRQMSKTEKASFDAAFDVLERKYPRTWIAKFDHKTALPRR